MSVTDLALSAAAVAGLLVVGVMVSRFRVCTADEIIVKTGLGIKNTWSGRKTVVWPFVQRHEVVSLAPTTHEFILTAMSEQFLQTDLPVDVVIRPADPYDDPDAWQRYCQNLGSADDAAMKRVLSATLEGKFRSLVAQRDIVDVFRDGRTECNDEIEAHLRITLALMGIELISAKIRSMDDEDGYFGAHRKRATEGAVLEAEADVALRRRKSVLSQEDERRQQVCGVAELAQMTRTVTAEQGQLATTSENAQHMLVAQSEAQLAVTRAEARRKAQTAAVEADASVKEHAAVRAAQVNAKEREAQEQLLRATVLAEANIKVEVLQRIADGEAYAMRVEAEGRAAAIRAVALADRDKANLEAEGTRSKLQAEADGYRDLLKAYDANPALAQFVKGNESGLWAEQARQAALALQNLKPEYHVWQTGGDAAGKDPILALAGQVIPPFQMLASKMGWPAASAASAASTK